MGKKKKGLSKEEAEAEFGSWDRFWMRPGKGLQPALQYDIAMKGKGREASWTPEQIAAYRDSADPKDLLTIEQRRSIAESMVSFGEGVARRARKELEELG